MAGRPPVTRETDADLCLRVRDDIRNHLAECLVTRGDKFPEASKEDKKAYFRIQDIKDAWSGRETIARALHPTTVSPDDAKFIQEKLLLFLSILVWMPAHKVLDQFRQYAYDSKGDILCSNDQLPLEQDDVPDFGDLASSRQFYSYQFMFKPIVISEAAKPTTIDHNHRLPFEAYAEELSEGAFGVVKKIAISPEYFEAKDGSKSTKITTVAVKRFQPREFSSLEASKKEIDNLEVLKESITQHKYIRTHLAALFHNGEHIILLPWANQYDLHLFLLQGHDQWGNEVYDFKKMFPDTSQDNFVHDVYKQMVNIAAALKWLHEDVRPHHKPMYFAHMDLKPDNILINNDAQSTVGEWVLTDFGISAFEENDEKENIRFVSIRDYVERQIFTLDRSAQRPAGTYQPPEIEHAGQWSGGINNDTTQRRVGRKSDIWSFGCIFAEVVAFSVDRSKAVNDFRTARQGHYGNDYFYRRSSNSSLTPDGSNQPYQLRPEMTKWLQDLPNILPTPAFANRVIECSVRSIFEILRVERSSRPGSKKLLESMEHLTQHFDRKFQGGSGCAAVKDVTQWEPTSSTDPSRQDQGILGLGQKTRVVERTVILDVKWSKTVVICIALCSSGKHIAAITTSPLPWMSRRRTLERHEISLADRNLTLRPSLDLRSGTSWNNVTMCEDIVVVWGDRANNVEVSIQFDSETTLTSLRYPWLATLKTVVATKNRCIVFVCHKHIYYVDLSKDQNLRSLVNSKEDHSFKDIAVDDNTGFLYIWSSGSEVETLQVGHIDVTSGSFVCKSAQNYYARTYGDYKATIYPFNGREGCAIRLNGDDIFCSPALMTQDTLPLNSIKLGQRSLVHVFNGLSILFTEKHRSGTYVKERLITQAGHDIQDEARSFRLKLDQSGEIAHIRVVPMPESDNLIIVVVARSGRILLVPITVVVSNALN